MPTNGTVKNDYFEYLDMLAISKTNMYGADIYLRRMFPALNLNPQLAKDILIEWRQTYNDRYPPQASL